MHGFHPEEWTDFFVATAGAAAAFTGLLFVAVSINLEQILKFEGLPERALETMSILLSVVVISLVSLAPGLSNRALGIFLLVEGIILTAGLIRLQTAEKAAPDRSEAKWTAQRITLSLAVGAPVVIGGISLMRDSGGGLYWVLGAVVAAFIAASANAWVLLVEIQR